MNKVSTAYTQKYNKKVSLLSQQTGKKKLNLNIKRKND